MEHPQPAFTLLTSLPIEYRVNESVFADWWTREGINASHDDDIEAYPEVWDVMELPDVLEDLSVDEFITLQPFTERLNLNAAAIGLGIDQVVYEPEKYPGLVYTPSGHNATIVAFWNDLFFSVGETADATTSAVTHTRERIEVIGIDEDIQFREIQTGRVSDFV